MRFLIKLSFVAILGFLFLNSTKTGQALTSSYHSEANREVAARKLHQVERLVRADATDIAERLDPRGIATRLKDSQAVSWVGERLPSADLETSLEVEFLGSSYRVAYGDEGLDLDRRAAPAQGES